jgi:predicted N-acetyltransferase YhbS
MADLPFPVIAAPTADASVRPARPADAEAITDVLLASWRTSYADLLPDGTLESLDHREVVDQWRSSIASPPTARHLVLVAGSGATVVGYAVASPHVASTEEQAPPTGEIAELVVHPDHLRQGHGSRLMAAAVDHLRNHGDAVIATWCAREDDARRTFFESAGFAFDGTVRRFDSGPGTDGLEEVRLVAELDPAAPATPV